MGLRRAVNRRRCAEALEGCLRGVMASTFSRQRAERRIGIGFVRDPPCCSHGAGLPPRYYARSLQDFLSRYLNYHKFRFYTTLRLHKRIPQESNSHIVILMAEMIKNFQNCRSAVLCRTLNRNHGIWIIHMSLSNSE